MKKTILQFAFGALAFMTFSTLAAQKQNINVAESNIHWLGKKVTGQHEGNLSLKSGEIETLDGVLIGGSFVVDMSSMTCTDLEGESAGNLIGHLKSDDFFGVDTHPEAKLNITAVEAKGEGKYAVTGDFTIKGATHPASFELVMTDGGATAKVTIDRSKYDIRYGSNSFFDNLGNKAIDNEFELDVTLKL